jgi:N6-L-threonylcarbamoyladenine synthase
MGLPYPGGPFIDKFAKEGNPESFQFNKPVIANYDFSFSGLKTSFLYFLRDRVKEDPDFVNRNKFNICASLQQTIVSILLNKLILASEKTGIKDIAVAGGVSANSGLRNSLIQTGQKKNWNVFIPDLKYSTDNAAMIAITGYYKFLIKEFGDHADIPYSRNSI